MRSGYDGHRWMDEERVSANLQVEQSMAVCKQLQLLGKLREEDHLRTWEPIWATQ